MIRNSINPPQIYSEWVEILDLLENRIDDESVLKALKQGTIAWQSGVAERFAKKIIDTINSRMNSASDRFQRDINYAKGQEKLIIQALLSLRKEMSFLLQAIDLPAIPEKDREQYCNLVIQQANEMQVSLEDSAKIDRSGKLLSIIRNHKVNEI